MAGLGAVSLGILDYSTNEERNLEGEDAMFGRVLALMVVLCVLVVQNLFAVDGVQRWVLAVGANDGGANAFWCKVLLAFGTIPLSALCCRKRGSVFFVGHLSRSRYRTRCAKRRY